MMAAPQQGIKVVAILELNGDAMHYRTRGGWDALREALEAPFQVDGDAVGPAGLSLAALYAKTAGETQPDAAAELALGLSRLRMEYPIVRRLPSESAMAVVHAAVEYAIKTQESVAHDDPTCPTALAVSARFQKLWDAVRMHLENKSRYGDRDDESWEPVVIGSKNAFTRRYTAKELREMDRPEFQALYRKAMELGIDGVLDDYLLESPAEAERCPSCSCCAKSTCERRECDTNICPG